MRKILFLIGAFVLFPSMFAGAAAPKIEEIFKRVDAHYDEIRTARFRVDRTLERGMQNQAERWEVFLRRPDGIRVEYDGPPRRIILSKGELYSEYIPQAKKALELDTNRLTEKARKEMIESLMPRVAIPGFRLGIDDALRQRMDFQFQREEQRDGRPTYVIEGRDKGGKSEGTMKVWIDRERYLLARLEVYDQKKFVSSIENQAFIEYAPGRWLPNRVAVQNNTPSAVEKATYRISGLSVNSPLEESFFQVKYSTDTQVTRPES